MIEFNANIPIYLQVVDIIKSDIMNGTLKPGYKISSVRGLALELGVNPNTIQKAFAELEREGFIRTERAVGRYVADNQALIQESKNQMIQESIRDFVKQMASLGVDQNQLIEYLQKEKREL